MDLFKIITTNEEISEVLKGIEKIGISMKEVAYRFEVSRPTLVNAKNNKTKLGNKLETKIRKKLNYLLIEPYYEGFEMGCHRLEDFNILNISTEEEQDLLFKFKAYTDCAYSLLKMYFTIDYKDKSDVVIGLNKAMKESGKICALMSKTEDMKGDNNFEI